MIALGLLGAALAAPTLYAPDAAPAAETAWRLAAGPGFTVISDEPAPTLRLDAAWTGERWGARVVGTGVGVYTPEVFVAGSARFRVWSGQRASIAPYVQAVEHLGASPLDHRLAGRLGVALERDGERWDLYAAIPLVGAAAWPSADVPAGRLGPFELLLAMEAGAAVSLGERNAIRAGLTGFMPTLGYRYDADRWFVDASAGSMGLAHVGGAQVGLRL